MEIKSNKRVVVTGRDIMLVGAVVCLLCCAYWVYRSVWCDDAQWLNAGISFVVGIGLLGFSRKKR